MARATDSPSIVVIFGDEKYQKLTRLEATLNELLPPEVDRALALSGWDASQDTEHGGPTITAVLEDLMTLPFLADRRVVVIRSADPFVTQHRQRLEAYAEKPSRTGVLVLECRTFPESTRLYKAVKAGGGRIVECRKLTGRAVMEFVIAESGRREKKLTPDAAGRLVDLVGADAGNLVSELEKLALFVGSRAEITPDDIALLVGQTREERIFSAVDAAALGQGVKALTIWHQVLETDSKALYRALGGVASMFRKWLMAHRLVDDGMALGAVAPRVQMWGRERELGAILHRHPPRTIRRYLAALAELDSQAKVGRRSIDRGVELLLARLASPAA